ncbi:MAG: hypothetical protein H6515_14725 [Microthrixaceae bacterium]|nr:hypothetical protein [Microthrixaceae bacterium]
MTQPSGTGNARHQAAVAATAELVEQLRADIVAQLEHLLDQDRHLEALAGTRSGGGLEFMTDEARALADKQTRTDRAIARGAGKIEDLGLVWVNSATMLAGGQAPAPVNLAAVSASAEILFTLQDYVRRLTRRVLPHLRALDPDHELVRRPPTTDGDTTELARDLVRLIDAVDDRPLLQELLRVLDHLDDTAANVIDGPAKTRHPEPCPWCGRHTLVIHHRIPGRGSAVIRCDGRHPCECDHTWCECHRNPVRHRHEWENSGRATHNWNTLRRLQNAAQENQRMETTAQDALDRVRDLHDQMPLYPWASECAHPAEHEPGWLEDLEQPGEYFCPLCPPVQVVCRSCRDDDGSEIPYPCPTIRAIEGDPES